MRDTAGGGCRRPLAVAGFGKRDGWARGFSAFAGWTELGYAWFDSSSGEGVAGNPDPVPQSNLTRIGLVQRPASRKVTAMAPAALTACASQSQRRKSASKESCNQAAG